MENENKVTNPTAEESATVETKATGNVETKVDYEAEYVRLMAENKKLKATSDKNASEAADFKKKWRATLDEQQQANLEKEEADKAMREELASLRRERDLSKTEKSFIALGYSEDLASKAAIAQMDGDFETLMGIQKSFIEQITKNVKAEQTKNMPTPPISNDSEKAMTQEEFDNLTVREQVEFKNKFPELFKKFTEEN